MNISVDMVRLQVRVPNYDFEHFTKKFFSCSPDVKSYLSSKFTDYRNNFIVHETIEINPFTSENTVNKFWLGFCHNSEKPNFKHNLVIEFNPNKCDITQGLLKRVLNAFYFSAHLVVVRSVDVAIDLDVPITNFFVDKLRKRYYCDITNGDGRTIYVGRRSQDGHIKIYNKAAEQGLTDVTWTRWEISIKFDDVELMQILLGKYDFAFNVPDVFYFDELDFNEFDTKMKCYLHSMLTGFVRLNDFDRYIKNKIKQTLAESASIKKIDKNIKTDVYNTIITYFTDFASTFMNLPDFIKHRQSKQSDVEGISLAPIASGKQLSFRDIQ